ncbi:MAG: CDP-alcohol phosphatidyltransferase family protein [Lachnospiraceae bacterium]|nr:CDP-alcohol phosphatidyltransferase family protein [Lachnospiraceae bacterium]
MIGIYNYTVILTYVGMVVSFVGISYAIDGNTKIAVFCLLIAGVCDMFDGAVASMRERTKREKRFGIQIDSLSDLISFGVLPVIIACREVPHNRLVATASGVYLLCALIRLAYFNVDEEERQEQTDAPREFYYGLPVTTAAVILPFLYFLAHRTRTPMRFVWPGSLFVVAIAFISPFYIRKPHFLMRIRRNTQDAATRDADDPAGDGSDR